MWQLTQPYISACSSRPLRDQRDVCSKLMQTCSWEKKEKQTSRETDFTFLWLGSFRWTCGSQSWMLSVWSCQRSAGFSLACRYVNPTFIAPPPKFLKWLETSNSEETLTASKTNYDGRRQMWRKKSINWGKKMPMCPVSVQVLFSMPNIIFMPTFKVAFIAPNPLHAKTVTESWNWNAATQKKNWSLKWFKWKTTDMNLWQMFPFLAPEVQTL